MSSHGDNTDTKIKAELGSFERDFRKLQELRETQAIAHDEEIAERHRLFAEADAVQADIEEGSVESLMRAKYRMAQAIDRLIEPLILNS